MSVTVIPGEENLYTTIKVLAALLADTTHDRVLAGWIGQRDSLVALSKCHVRAGDVERQIEVIVDRVGPIFEGGEPAVLRDMVRALSGLVAARPYPMTSPNTKVTTGGDKDARGYPAPLTISSNTWTYVFEVRAP